MNVFVITFVVVGLVFFVLVLPAILIKVIAPMFGMRGSTRRAGTPARRPCPGGDACAAP